MAKVRVILVFGGKSAEHEVSILSAKNVYQALDKNKYEVILVGIDRMGSWHLSGNPKLLLESAPEKLDVKTVGPQIGAGEIESSTVQQVVFPILHGPYGEDGTIQGMLKLMNLPFVGPSVLGSALGMDKDVMKRLLRDAEIPVAKFESIKLNEYKDSKEEFDRIQKKLGLPMFVKPANMGSSIGINKVKDFEGYKNAMREAFSYDTKVVIEEAIVGREIECSVLGNENPKASLPGEVINNTEFYSYEAKYMDANASKTIIPAKELSPELIKKIQALAVKTFGVLECEGMARVDMFLKPSGEILINEINTIPGFTKISMYPKMWEASGLSYSDLLDELIRLAIARHERDNRLKSKPDLKGKSFNA